jgi:hypothetical protein
MVRRIGSIPLGVPGRVKNSDPPNMHVLVEHDEEDTGGFFIWQSPPEDAPAAGGYRFDDWVESADALEKYFDQSGWKIEWQDADADAKETI